MLAIQRIRVTWTARGRGAPEATARGRLPKAFPLPPGGDAGEVLLHEIRMQEATGYDPSEEIRIHGSLSDVDWLNLKREPNGAIRIERNPVWASYPVTRRAVHLATLAPGQSARYRANFRFSGYSMTWTYCDWTVNIAHEPPHRDTFLECRFDVDLDDRVTLYGRR